MIVHVFIIKSVVRLCVVNATPATSTWIIACMWPACRPESVAYSKKPKVWTRCIKLTPQLYADSNSLASH